MEEKKSFCFYCHVALASHEKRVQFEGKDFHPDCDKARRRRTRLTQFFRELKTIPLKVEPHHPHGR